MAIRTWRSTNQGDKEYRLAVGPVSKERAEIAKREASKAGYYARVTPYKGKWAMWTTQPVPWSAREFKGRNKYIPRVGAYYKHGELRPRMVKAGWRRGRRWCNA